MSITTKLCNDGSRRWYKDEKLHREDGPAIEFIGNTRTYSWYFEGRVHREGGPAIVIDNDMQQWWRHGNLHRIDGPAIVSNTTKQWFQNGLLHREDGPAIEYTRKLYKNNWFRHGKLYVAGEIKCIAIAMSPLNLPPYVLLWIFQWSHPEIMNISEIKLVALLEGLRNSRNRIKGIE